MQLKLENLPQNLSYCITLTWISLKSAINNVVRKQMPQEIPWQLKSATIAIEA